MTPHKDGVDQVRMCLSLVGVATVLASCALFETDAERGHYVAAKWCSECHRIAPDEASGMRPGHIMPPPVDAPSFMEVSARSSFSATELDDFLRSVHLPMPTYRLRDDERREVVAYILSLRPVQRAQ